MITDLQIQELCKAAIDIRENCYAPYSHFCVGAALLTASGKIYTGVNVENAAYGPSNCAERTAVFKAVSEGERTFTAIAIAGGPEDGKLDYCPPCGVCRQVLAEFCAADFEIILPSSSGETKRFTLAELLPESFGPDNL
ncbi:MAG: cytidine deaminase [Clostridiales bacterium]|nr:cytidine deaminase [Clostridiales bacterium]